MKKFTAFTLAEVLITLGIIGIVAQATIPVLVGDLNKQSYTVGLKKSYTTFNQALITMAADVGTPGDLNASGAFDTAGTQQLKNQKFGNAIKKYFKLTKDCGTAVGCFSQNIAGGYDGSGARDSGYYNSTDFYKFVTADGMFYALKSYVCFAGGGQTYMKEVCGSLAIDINGDKGPNNWGRDVFLFYVTNGKGPMLYPPSAIDDTWDAYWKTNPSMCNVPNATNNWTCASRVIDEGWQMKY